MRSSIVSLLKENKYMYKYRRCIIHISKGMYGNEYTNTAREILT